MTKYHDILRVRKDASKDEIKAAYKELAREHHPDKGGKEEEFVKIGEAYEKLTNGTAEQEINFDHAFFNAQFHNAKVRLGDSIHKCNITLEDLYTGSIKKFKISRTKMCVGCYSKCSACHGNGTIRHQLQLGPFMQIMEQRCGQCAGNGQVKSKPECSLCNNKGRIIEDQIIQINIAKASPSEQQFVFKEWGIQPTKDNEEAGDLIVVTNLLPHADFVRKNEKDLLYTTHISFKNAITGMILKIPFFDSTLEINTLGFGIVNPGKEYFILGKGLSPDGNMCIRFMIDYPDKVLQIEEAQRINQAFSAVGIN
jgi:DnaJ-class molecular chaperone